MSETQAAREAAEIALGQYASSVRDEPWIAGLYDALRDLLDASAVSPAPEPCEWCDKPHVGFAKWQGDDKAHPSCGEHGHGFQPVPVSPAPEDEREALATIEIPIVVLPGRPHRGYYTLGYDAADFLIANGWRRQGPPTEAEVERAARALFEEPGAMSPDSPDYMEWAEVAETDPTRADIWRADARRVLEAALAPASPVPDRTEENTSASPEHDTPI